MRPVRLIVVLLGAGLPAACHPTAPAAQATPRGEAGAGLTRSVTGIPVTDDSGNVMEFPFLGGFDHPRPQLVDIDGDEDLDLFLQEYTGALMYFENTGSRAAPAWTWRTGDWQDLDIGEWSRFVDMDNDGVIDLMTESPFSYIRYFRNEGTVRQPKMVLAIDTLTDAGGKPIFSDRQNIPQFVDVDCNGRLDMLLGRASGRVTRYEMKRPGAAGIREFEFLTDEFQGILIIGQDFMGPGFGSMHGANTMVVKDIDRDGDQDIIWGDFFEPGLLWLVNSATCGRPDIGRDTVPFPPNAPLNTSGYNAPAIADMDADNDLDLLVGVLGGAYNPNRSTRSNLIHLEQTGPLRFTYRSGMYLSQVDLGSETLPAIADIDGDGDLDLVIGNKIEPDDQRHGALHWFENTGTPSSPAFRMRGELPSEGLYHMATAFGDLDGDGRDEVLMGTFKDAIRLYRVEKGDTPGLILADSALVRITRGSNTTPALADIDDDGDLDLFIGESSGDINFYRNDGSAARPAFILVSEALDSIDVGRRSAPAFLDVEGDGDQDLVIGNEDGPLVLYRNEGSPSVARFERDDSWNLPLPPYSAPAFADLDGDGNPELVSGSAGGGLLLFR